MKVAMFYHSVLSCWNHGNAHFLRGIARELLARGAEVRVFEPADGWSRSQALLEENGGAALREAADLLPRMKLHAYRAEYIDCEEAIGDADLVLVHEWTDPDIIRRIGRARHRGGAFTLLFHDTHHRAISAPTQIDALELDAYDGVLAFGQALTQAYRVRGWGRKAFTWHEAADTALFRPLPTDGGALDLVWIGNWGDDERSAELQRYLVEPVAALGLRTEVYGVRYPPHALERLQQAGARFGGWLPNHQVPRIFARAKVTVHVPRGPYTQALSGIPTIRMFEALACGIPLVCSPWEDEENLFPVDSYLKAKSPAEMTASLRAVIADRALAGELSRRGLAAIRERHTCTHRVDELLSIYAAVRGGAQRPGSAAAACHVEAV